MEKKRSIRTYGGYFEAFMETLTEKEQDKIQYGVIGNFVSSKIGKVKST